ncbi:hypothetical protein QAD02_018515 [Eretmocerus hayati]|uniref:Uncharacterized protein n=1 Tax=Eretmocerus hayati TaxID=131215 RepID=A0ACC2PI48_9HYME|nr:hypothetical protein QAD02_018515 [Eretmocerus hayati]
MASLRTTLGVNELTDKKHNLFRALVAEFLGTMLLNFFGCGSAITGDVLTISFSFGLTVAGVIQAIGHISGGHVNPAVTVGLLAIGKVSLIRALLYIIVQCGGAIAGSAVLRALTDNEYVDKIGALKLESNTSPVQGFGVEFFLAFILVLVVCGACDPGKPESKSLAPLIIGLAVTVGHIVGIKRTSTGMNPARALGAAVVSNSYPEHWLYWVGPLLGGPAAALIYAHVLGHVKESELPKPYASVSTEEKEVTYYNNN